MAVQSRSALRVARDCRACRLPSPDAGNQSRELLLIQRQVIYRLSACKILHPLPFVISTNHLDHFPFHRCLHHSYLLLSSGLIIPYWLVTFVHVHAACTHLNLVYLYQPIVIGEAFRLLVILLLLALPCLNSLARCVITCPIWLNNPRQRGLEVFMNLSQSRFSPQAAAILTSSGFFLP